jgi:uncharacterized protein YbaR (Trm112 family)
VNHHVNQKLLAILRCPEDRSPLSLADEELVSELNAAIQAGWLRNRAGQRVDRLLEGGLIREAGDLLYPIVDQIPIMLHDEAIPLAQLDDQEL